MNMFPAVTVVMPVYNGEKHLSEAINSILVQSFVNFEFIIINDASTDGTNNILQEYAESDSRIRILTNERNCKIAASLNRGINEARSPLIARMDADDWSHPERLEKQFLFMQEDPRVAVCGTWLEVYETGEPWKWPCCNKEIITDLLFNVPIAHPTAMIRRDILVNIGGYDVTMPPAEDYHLWVRLACTGNVKFANIPQALLRYRVYPDLDRSFYGAKQAHVANMVRCELLHRLGLFPMDKQLRYHRILGGIEEARGFQDITACLAWKDTLLDANKNAQFCDQDALESRLGYAMPKMFWRMVRESLARVWRRVAPQCVRKLYSHLQIVLHKVI